MTSPNDRWFAARQTQLVYVPHSTLETFGETSVQYRMVSQISDTQVRLRSGVVKAARPRIVTPHYFAAQALENFGEEAQKYFQDFISRREGIHILQYGLMFQKEDHHEETITGNAREIADQLGKEAQDNLNETRCVLIGNDRFWEISLLFFLRMLVERSVPVNAREMAGRGLFSLKHGIPLAVLNEIDTDFANATTRELADKLGCKLRDYGIFDEFEDRFFDLYGRFCK